MNSRRRQKLTRLILTCLLAASLPFGRFNAYAANARIAFSDPSATVGKEVTVTMKVSSNGGEPLGSCDVMLAYDPNYLEFVSGDSASGGAGSIHVLGTMESASQSVFNFSLKFKTLQAGTSKISVSRQEVYDVNAQAVTVDRQGESTVTINSPATASSDANLKSLKISPGTLTPEFSPAVESYTAEVGADTASLVVNAEASSPAAQVSVEGKDQLNAGENQVVCRVAAEDGRTVKSYTITVTKAEGGAAETEAPAMGDMSVTLNDVVYTIASSFDEAGLPEGFETAVYTYKGTEVTAGKGLEKDLLLLYLQAADGTGGFFIYNEATDGWSPFVSVDTGAKSVVIVPLDEGVEAPSGFVPRKIAIDDKKVDGWIWEGDTAKEKQYCIFYGMNWNGEKGFYRYDLSERTLQRYFRDPTGGGASKEDYNKVATDYNNLIHDYDMQFIIIIVLIVVVAALFLLVILLLNRGGKSGPPSGYEPEPRRGRTRDEGNFRRVRRGRKEVEQENPYDGEEVFFDINDGEKEPPQENMKRERPAPRRKEPETLREERESPVFRPVETFEERGRRLQSGSARQRDRDFEERAQESERAGHFSVRDGGRVPKVSRYSREEWDMMDKKDSFSGDRKQTVPEKEEEILPIDLQGEWEDDFPEAESLDDMERGLGGRRGVQPDKDDGDFEFFDLNSR